MIKDQFTSAIVFRRYVFTILRARRSGVVFDTGYIILIK